MQEFGSQPKKVEYQTAGFFVRIKPNKIHKAQEVRSTSGGATCCTL